MPVDGAYPRIPATGTGESALHCLLFGVEKDHLSKRLSRTCGSFDYEGESCSTLMCTSDLRNEIMQPDGKTVQKVNDQRGVDSAEDRFQPEGTTRETSAQTKQVHHANEECDDHTTTRNMAITQNTGCAR